MIDGEYRDRVVPAVFADSSCRNGDEEWFHGGWARLQTGKNGGHADLADGWITDAGEEIAWFADRHAADA